MKTTSDTGWLADAMYGCECSVVTESPQETAAVRGQIQLVARKQYSNPPIHGALIVTRVLSSPDLKQQWYKEVKVSPVSPSLRQQTGALDGASRAVSAILESAQLARLKTIVLAILGVSTLVVILSVVAGALMQSVCGRAGHGGSDHLDARCTAEQAGGSGLEAAVEPHHRPGEPVVPQ